MKSGKADSKYMSMGCGGDERRSGRQALLVFRCIVLQRTVLNNEYAIPSFDSICYQKTFTHSPQTHADDIVKRFRLPPCPS